MISEGSCDTEDWRNDAEKSALTSFKKIHKKYITIENSYFCNNISQYYYFYCIFHQITQT